MFRNAANIITGVRALLAPIIFTQIVQNRVELSIILYSTALLTDVIDGYVARRTGSASTQGAFFDACSDFLLVLSGAMGCVALKLLDPWILGVIVLMFAQFILGFGARVVFDPFGKAFGIFTLVIIPCLLAVSMIVSLVESSILFLGFGSFIGRRLYLMNRETLWGLHDLTLRYVMHVPGLNPR